jgi:hypothetical protein
MTLAHFRNQQYVGEVRHRGEDGYFVILRGPSIQETFSVPRVLRSGRSGLDAILDEVDNRIEHKETQ